MILLRPDCLAFKNDEGESIPAEPMHLSLELAGASAASLDQHILENAAGAVVHYFKNDLGQQEVTAEEFAAAMERVLRGLGLDIQANPSPEPPLRLADADLLRIAGESSDGWELVFFARLRAELRRQLEHAPQILRFRGLRGCAMRLAGAKRWSRRCQGLSDQIVEYLRQCLSAEHRTEPCALWVQA